MFHKLKRRLVLLYGITSSVILTVIITGVFVVNYKQNQEQIKVLFQKNVEQVAEKIRSGNVISNSWLTKMQMENHLQILIEDNGKLLTKYSGIDTTVDKVEHIEKMKEMAAEEGIYLDHKPMYSAVEKTSVFTLYQSSRDIYLGMATLIPTDTGWQNIMVIYSDNSVVNYLFEQLPLFVLLDFIGAATFFLISSLYIGKVIKPLEEGQKKQNAFVAAASHELLSPLTVIKAGISSIREDGSKADQFLPHIEGECDRMTRLISDMLLLASADAKTWSLQKEQVDMDTLLIECFDMLCTCYNKKNYELSLDLQEEELHEINGDGERIKQILTILIDNAMSYTPPGATIALRVYNQKHFVVVEVEDHGKGIHELDKKQVFERFYQGDKSRNEKKHFGLGLSIAKELIELHGGDISIKDTVGGGATFSFRLPY